MILIGQYDSPFVRRVGVALTLYGLTFRHEPWSVFGDAEKIRAFNPLTRVPTMVLDDGAVLMDSHAIIDWLDQQVPPEQRMFPTSEPARHQAMRIASLGTGLADKAVSLFYERRLHTEVSAVWEARCRTQLSHTLDVLEAERAACTTPYWFGGAVGHADIAVACALRFVGDVHAGVFDLARYSALKAHCMSMEPLPAMQQIQQAFNPPA